MSSWIWAVWGALAVFVLVVAAGGAFAVVRALEFWRTYKRSSSVLQAGAAVLAARAEEAARKGDRAGAGSERLAAAGAQLQRSLAYARVVADAAGDVRATLTGLRGSVPRK